MGSASTDSGIDNGRPAATPRNLPPRTVLAPLAVSGGELAIGKVDSDENVVSGLRSTSTSTSGVGMWHELSTGFEATLSSTAAETEWVILAPSATGGTSSSAADDAGSDDNALTTENGASVGRHCLLGRIPAENEDGTNFPRPAKRFVRASGRAELVGCTDSIRV